MSTGLTILLIACLLVAGLLVWRYIEIGQKPGIDALPGKPRGKRRE